jgi:GNAT superfamily N-acetyltransferase
VAGELVVREARPGDARAIAEASVASRRWSYRDLVTDADLQALSVEATTADFAEGLAELPPGEAVFVAERTSRVVGYAYVLRSPTPMSQPRPPNWAASTLRKRCTDVAPALLDAAIEHTRATGHDVLTLWVRRENGRARRFYEKNGTRRDGAGRSRPHDVLPTEMHEIRYRMAL